jgi:hypothetical protein
VTGRQPGGSGLDEDALIAAAGLIGRTGARGFEIGYTDEEMNDWYAHAQYQGARIIEEHHRGPVEAAEALARRLLTGAQCQGCGGLVALSSAGAVAFGGMMMDGRTWTTEEAAAAGQCRWTRQGRTWVSACGLGSGDGPRPPRRERRAAAARARRNKRGGR